MKPGQRVLFALRKMIAAGEIRCGERIAEIQTAAALGVSRMPVRTALRSLEREGLVVRLGGRGYTARCVTATDIRDAIAVRGVLEGFVVRLVAERGCSPELRARLESLLEHGNTLFRAKRFTVNALGKYRDYNLAFHNALVAASDNNALIDALRRNGYLPFAGADAFAFDLSDLDRERNRLLAAHRQHRKAFAAIMEGNAEAAELIMRDHAFAAMRNANIFSAENGISVTAAAQAMTAD